MNQNEIREILNNSETYAEFFKCLGHPNRIAVLTKLCEKDHTVTQLKILYICNKQLYPKF